MASTKFILIGENVLNFHASDDSYYEEWFDDVEDGWIAYINFRPYSIAEMSHNRLDYYTNSGGQLDDMTWRSLLPQQLFQQLKRYLAVGLPDQLSKVRSTEEISLPSASTRKLFRIATGITFTSIGR